MMKIGSIERWMRSDRSEVKDKIERQLESEDRKGDTKEIQRTERTLHGEMQEKKNDSRLSSKARGETDGDEEWGSCGKSGSYT